jgi:hypothetical protein
VRSLLERWWARLRAVFVKRTLDREFDLELEHHLELLTADNVKAGMTPTEARRQAHLALGGLEQTRELHRETRGLPLLEQFGGDLRHAGRVFRRERGFTMVVLAILAIGIGLNAAVFSLVNTVIFRPLPFAEAGRLIWMPTSGRGTGRVSLHRSTRGRGSSNRTAHSIASRPIIPFRPCTRPVWRRAASRRARSATVFRRACSDCSACSRCTAGCLPRKTSRRMPVNA